MLQVFEAPECCCSSEWPVLLPQSCVVFMEAGLPAGLVRPARREEGAARPNAWIRYVEWSGSRKSPRPSNHPSGEAEQKSVRMSVLNQQTHTPFLLPTDWEDTPTLPQSFLWTGQTHPPSRVCPFGRKEGGRVGWMKSHPPSYGQDRPSHPRSIPSTDRADQPTLPPFY